MDSILNSTKRLVGGITKDDHSFDSDIIMHINATFVTLKQLGVGPKTGFSISDENATWTDYLADDPNVGLVKTYMGAKVKLLFDPPLNSSHLAALEKSISELEWRITNPV